MQSFPSHQSFVPRLEFTFLSEKDTAKPQNGDKLGQDQSQSALKKFIHCKAYNIKKKSCKLLINLCLIRTEGLKNRVHYTPTLYIMINSTTGKYCWCSSFHFILQDFGNLQIQKTEPPRLLHNTQQHRKALLSIFHLNGRSLGFHPQNHSVIIKSATKNSHNQKHSHTYDFIPKARATLYRIPTSCMITNSTK